MSSSSVDSSSVSLADAAETVFLQAKADALPLAYLAEKSDRPLYWFARHLLAIVGGTATSASGARVPVGRKDVDVLMLNDALTALEADGIAQLTALTIAKADIARYLDWARTVQ